MIRDAEVKESYSMPLYSELCLLYSDAVKIGYVVRVSADDVEVAVQHG